MRLPDLFLRRVQRGARLFFMFGLHTGLIRAVAGISKACSSNEEKILQELKNQGIFDRIEFFISSLFP